MKYDGICQFVVLSLFFIDHFLQYFLICFATWFSSPPRTRTLILVGLFIENSHSSPKAAFFFDYFRVALLLGRIIMGFSGFFLKVSF